MRKKLAILLAVVFVVWLGTGMLAQGDNVIQKKGFSITIPDGWVEIPRNVIDDYQENVSKLTPNIDVKYDYGFQVEGNEWLTYPYILIQVKHVGRLPKSQLKKLEKFSMQEALDERKKDLSTMMNNIKAGKMIYDKALNLIFLRIEASVIGVGPITGLSGIKPTQKGLIQVACYATREGFKNYENLFRNIVTSVQPDPDMVYNPLTDDNSVLSPFMRRVILGGVIGGLIALILGVLRKKKG